MSLRNTVLVSLDLGTTATYYFRQHFPVAGKFKSTIKPRVTAVEQKEKIVGSRKRKARKESITRRDVSLTENLVPETDALFALATLAEVAANENHIGEKTI